jgi:hypothetical protein
VHIKFQNTAITFQDVWLEEPNDEKTGKRKVDKKIPTLKGKTPRF